MMARAKRGLMLVVAVALTGCATTPPLAASWYAVDKEEVSKRGDLQVVPDDIYLLIVNNGPKKVRIDQLFFNITKVDGPPVELAEGRFLLFPSGIMNRAPQEEKCELPVRMSAFLDGRNKEVSVPVTGKLPSALSAEWVTSCVVKHNSGETAR